MTSHKFHAPGWLQTRIVLGIPSPWDKYLLSSPDQPNSPFDYNFENGPSNVFAALNDLKRAPCLDVHLSRKKKIISFNYKLPLTNNLIQYPDNIYFKSNNTPQSNDTLWKKTHQTKNKLNVRLYKHIAKKLSFFLSSFISKCSLSGFILANLSNQELIL